MQNSLDRLFDGLIETLHDIVLPDVGDAYAREQLLAALDLLANIAVRVEWQVGVETSSDRTRAVEHRELSEDEARREHARQFRDLRLAHRRLKGLIAGGVRRA